MENGSYAAKNHCGRVGRIATPTPLGVGDSKLQMSRRLEVYLVMSEVIGHLDLLLDEGSAVLEQRDGVEFARVA